MQNKKGAIDWAPRSGSKPRSYPDASSSSSRLTEHGAGLTCSPSLHRGGLSPPTPPRRPPGALGSSPGTGACAAWPKRLLGTWRRPAPAAPPGGGATRGRPL